MTHITGRVPNRDEFSTATEFIVHVGGSAPDLFGRTQFAAFWPTDQEWVPGGVRGQVFFASLEEFVARQRDQGYTVRTVDMEPCRPAMPVLCRDAAAGRERPTAPEPRRRRSSRTARTSFT